MAYTPKTWADEQAGGTPITAAELNRMEDGIAGGKVFTPEAYGAIGDGVVNDQAAIVAAIAAATPGSRILFAPGKTYAHNATITVDKPDLTFDGWNSTLLATVPGSASFKFWYGADRITVNGLKHKVALGGATRGNQDLDMSPFVLQDTVDFVLNGVTSESSQATGIFVYGSQRFRIINPTVIRSLADGIHMTYGSHYGVVEKPVVVESGDDGVAVVSYTNNPSVTRHIQVNSPRIWRPKARGITVVGGEDITYTDIQVYDSRGAGIYFSSEVASYDTRPVRRVRALGGNLTRCNTDAAIAHGAIHLFNEAATANDAIEIADINILDTPVSVNGTIGLLAYNGGSYTNSSISRIHVSGRGPSSDIFGNVTPGAGISVDIDSRDRLPDEYMLTADESKSTTSMQQVSGLLFYPKATGTYEIVVQGSYKSATTTSGPRFSVQGNVGIGNVITELDQSISAISSYRAVGGWAVGIGSNPSLANTWLPFSLRAIIEVTSNSSAGNLGLTWASSTDTVAQSLMYGTKATLRRIS